MRHRPALAALALAATFLAIYLPDVGHGFISDDFRWIAESRVERPGEIASLFSANIGFYRPLVASTFAVDHAVWGSQAWGYAFTNLLLIGASAGLLFRLARQLGLVPAAALAAAGVWMLNFHGVNMSLLWISGRTSLMASVFALATASLVVRGRFVAAGIACLAAMLSKEEAIALPAVALAFQQSTLVGADRLRAAIRTWPLWAALVGYLALRAASGAFWPADAPSYYAFTLSPLAVGRNVLEYADRAGTTAAVAALLVSAFVRVRKVDVGPAERAALVLAVWWVPAMYALTVLLPVRSSLYAVLPSIGTALAFGALASAAMRRNPVRLARAATVLLIAAAALIPVYRSRNVRWVEPAELSERVMTTLQRETTGRPAGHVVLVDDVTQRFSLESAFGALFQDAVTLRLDPGWTGEIVTDLAASRRGADLVFRLANGTLDRIE